MTNLQKSKRALKRVKTLLETSIGYEINGLMADIISENIDVIIVEVEQQEKRNKEYHNSKS